MWHQYYLFGPLTVYHIIQFEWSNRKINTLGSGLLAQSIQSECINQLTVYCMWIYIQPKDQMNHSS